MPTVSDFSNVHEAIDFLLQRRWCCLLYTSIRGERPIKDKKYDTMKHPNIKKSRDGGAPAYVHKREVPDYRLPDLPYGEEDLDYIEILDDPDDEDEEDFFQEENKEEEYDEEWKKMCIRDRNTADVTGW